MDKVHAGYVKVSNELLCEILDFKGGKIWAVRMDIWGAPEFLIEHLDMPETIEGQTIASVNVALQTHYAKKGGIIKIERINPPKQEVSNG